jgi:hypothetical protein
LHELLVKCAKDSVEVICVNKIRVTIAASVSACSVAAAFAAADLSNTLNMSICDIDDAFSRFYYEKIAFYCEKLAGKRIRSAAVNFYHFPYQALKKVISISASISASMTLVTVPIISIKLTGNKMMVTAKTHKKSLR